MIKFYKKKLVFISILVFSFLFIFSLYLFIKVNRHFSKVMIDSYHQDQLHLIQTMASGMQRVIDQLHRELIHFSKQEKLQSASADYMDLFQDFFRVFYGQINSIAKINLAREVEYVYPDIGEYHTKDMSTSVCVKEAFKTKNTTISKCFTTETGAYVLAINQPILIKEEKNEIVKGVIRCVIHLDTLTNFLNIDAGTTNVQKGMIWIIDQEGTIIYHSDTKFKLKKYENILADKKQQMKISSEGLNSPYYLIKKGIQAFGIYPFWQNTEELFAMTPLKVGSKIWMIGTTTPYISIYSPIKKNNQHTFFLIITLFVIFSLGGLILHYLNKKKTILETQTTFLKKKVELEEEIKKERDRLNILLESMADSVLIINSNYQVEYMNQTAISNFGEQIGRRCFEVLRGCDRPCDTCQLNDKEQHPMTTTRFHCEDRKRNKWYEINAAPLQRDEQGKCLVAILRDVTRERELEEKLKNSEKKYRTLLTYTDDIIMVQSYSGKVLYVSQSIENILGYLPEEIYQKPFHSLFTENPINDPWREEIKSQADLQHHLQPHLIECKTKTREKIILEANESIVFDHDGPEKRLMGVYRDITERKRLEEQLLQSERLRLLSLTKRFRYRELIGKTPKMQEIYELIEAVSQSKATVLILGKTGTGKELVARAIHYQGPLAKGPFIGVNCAALSEGLLESELFGHERGAFTGALKNKVGRFELADGGTLFLDEIGEISLNVQTKLLRVLQEHKFERVGGEKTIKVNVRIIAATNKELYKEIQKGKFREDLFYRLNVVEIMLPSLSERIDDLPLLMTHFIEKFNQETGKKIQGSSRKTMNILSNYHWPGNVRELENVIEHAFVKCDQDLINPDHLPQIFTESKSGNIIKEGVKKGLVKDQIEKDILLNTLKKYDWNLPLVMEKLNISRTTLWRKLTKYNLKNP